MAFTNFYMQSGGSNLNAGSTTDNAAPFTYAGGTFVRATGVFTVASGNPSSDGVAVGDWVSIYTTAGATTATFIGKCTARDTTTITVEITTNKLGLTNTVSETAAAATAKVGGAWASEIVIASGGLGSFTLAFDAKVNIKQATYTLAASRTTQFVGTARFSMWLSGYNTTPGDLDADTTNSLSKPVFSGGSNIFTFSSTNTIFSGLSFTNSVNANFCVVFNGAQQYVSRCRVENTNSGTNAPAAQSGQSQQIYEYCYFKSPTTTTSNGVFVGGPTLIFNGCVFEGGGKAGCDAGSAAYAMFNDCVFLTNTGVGILSSTGRVMAFRCTFSAITGDGIKWSGTPGAGSFVSACIFSSCSGSGINNASGTDTRDVFCTCNDFYNCGSNTTGFGNAPLLFPQSESSAVLTSGSNMTPVNGSNARAHGFPGIFENQSYSSFTNIGAVQQVVAGSETAVVFGG